MLYKELKESQYPIFIWGAGSMSVEVANRLKEHDILFVGKFIDMESDKAHIISDEKYIFVLNEIKQQYTAIDVVMGHGHYEKKKEMEAYPFVHKVYIIPNPYTQYSGPNLEYVRNHKSQIDYVLEHLADEKSRLVFEKYIAVNETNDIRQLLDYDICIDGMYGFEELKIDANEVFMDIGAWEGDTIISFLKKTNGCYKYIYAVEPDPDSYQKLKSNFMEMDNMEFYQCGLGDKEGEIFLKSETTQSAFLSKSGNGQRIKVYTIDNLLKNKKVDLIKIVVPFMQFNILQGGVNVIRANRPRLIINVGADNRFSLYDIIKLISDFQLNYKCSLRFDFPMPTRLFLYAY